MPVDPREILVRRVARLVVPAGRDARPLTALAAMLHDLEGLGFVCAPALLDRSRTQSDEELARLYRATLPTLARRVGARAR